MPSPAVHGERASREPTIARVRPGSASDQERRIGLTLLVLDRSRRLRVAKRSSGVGAADRSCVAEALACCAL